MKSRLKKTTLLVLIFCFLLLASPSFAATPTPVAGPCAGTRALLPLLPGAPDPCSSPAAYVVYWFYLSLYLAGIAALLILVFAGFMRLVSGIVPGAVSSANKMVTGAALGLILLFSGWLLLKTLNPKLLNISNSQFPALGGYIMSFLPTKVGAGEKSNLSWALFFEKVDHGILNCYDAKDQQTIKDKNIAAYGNISYDSMVEGPHFCRITAQDQDNNTVGMGYADLIVTPACKLTWEKRTKGKGTLTWETSNGATTANVSCYGKARLECSPGDWHDSCRYAPPGKKSVAVEKGTLTWSNSQSCFIKIEKPWETTCAIPIEFP